MGFADPGEDDIPPEFDSDRRHRSDMHYFSKARVLGRGRAAGKFLSAITILNNGAAEQSLAADGAIACFSNGLFSAVEC
jgi:hypothetical protein